MAHLPDVVVVTRKKPHELLLLVLSVLSGMAYFLEPDGKPDVIPVQVSIAWAVLLMSSGLFGLLGVAIQRWQLLRGMRIERGALQLQAGLVIIYGSSLVAFVGWQSLVSLAAALVWAGANAWESRLISRDLCLIEGVSR